MLELYERGYGSFMNKIYIFIHNQLCNLRTNRYNTVLQFDRLQMYNRDRDSARGWSHDCTRRTQFLHSGQKPESRRRRQSSSSCCSAAGSNEANRAARGARERGAGHRAPHCSRLQQRQESGEIVGGNWSVFGQRQPAEGSENFASLPTLPYIVNRARTSKIASRDSCRSLPQVAHSFDPTKIFG